MGQLLGEPFAQNVQGTLLYDVRDTGQDVAHGARFSVTNDESSFHTDNSFGDDGPRLRRPALPERRPGPAASARSSAATPSTTSLRRETPDVLEVLRRPFHVDRRGGVRQGEAPTARFPVIGGDGRETAVPLPPLLDRGRAREGRRAADAGAGARPWTCSTACWRARSCGPSSRLEPGRDVLHQQPLDPAQPHRVRGPRRAGAAPAPGAPVAAGRFIVSRTNNGALNEAAEQLRAAVRHDGEPNPPGIATTLPLVELGARLALANLHSAGDKNLIVDATAFAARPAASPGFIDFDVLAGPAADPVLIRAHHPRAELVEDLERRLVARQAKLSPKLHGRHAGCLAGHQIGRPKPSLSGVCRRAMTVPTVNPVSRRHLRQRKTPGRFAKRNGSPAA